MPWTTSERVTALRRRSTTVDVVVETLDGWRRHQSGRNASVLSFWGFLSIFPLLLVATTVLGLLLEGNDDLQQRIVDGALDDIPVIGSQLAQDPESLTGSVWVLVVGLLGALWSSTRAFVGLQLALDDVWEIPVDDRAGLPATRGKAVVGILIIGASQVAGVALASVVQAADLPELGQFLVITGTAVVNILVAAAMFRFLTSKDTTWQMVWPGAIVSGIGFTLIIHFGTAIVRRIVDNASDTYGQFALVLGLVTWLGLLSIVALMAAELNAALVRRNVDLLEAVTPGG